MNFIFPTAYFPNIQYVALFLKAYNPRIELFETYHKQTCRTRCNVMTANGLQTLTIPVVKTNGNHTMTKDMTVSYIEPWQQIHQRCLESAYKKSPFFDHYFHLFEPVFEKKFDFLVEINEFALKAIFKALKINKEINYTDTFEDIKDENDYRLSLSKLNTTNSETYPPYYQVFEDRQPFTPNLSILDLLFNEGPESLDYLNNLIRISNPDVIHTH